MGTLTDRRGIPVTAANPAAVAQFDATVRHFLSHCRHTPDALGATLATDPEMVLAHAARGFFAGFLAQARLGPVIDQALVQADASLAARGGTERERRLVEALRHWRRGDWRGAADRLTLLSGDFPLDALTVKLTHAAHFMLGAAAEMCAATEAVLPHWTDDTPDAGFVHGCHAFGLEECGAHAEAERVGRHAVALEPGDAWGLHAVAHVMEMTGRPADGLAWLADRPDAWAHCNNFADHIVWHRALFHVELDQPEPVLALYDRCIRSSGSDDFRDISNGASLLWRLEAVGVNVGPRWHELAELAAGHCGDHTLVFADAHYLLALGGAGRHREADRFLAAARTAAAERSGTQPDVARTVGLTLLDAIAAVQRGHPGRAVDLLAPVRGEIIRIGGSHAQRDLFARLLIEAALADGQVGFAKTLLAERAARYLASPWAASRLATTLAPAA